MNIEYTCIKGKGKGIYKNTISSVATEEKPNDNPMPVVYPEIDTNEPDFEGFPQEIDYPDYGEDYGVMGVDSEIDSNDFKSIVREVRQDIAEGKFLDKFLRYMELLKVNRYELDSFLDYEFDFNNPENFEIKVKKEQVFDRLFSLYCPDDVFTIPAKTNHHLRQYLDRLEPDGRYFPKKQLTLFGEGK